MVKTKLRHPGTVAGRKSGAPSCLIDTSESDQQHDKDDWVIVKKQRVIILIPAVPLSTKISITATHGPSNIASNNFQLQMGTSKVLPSVNDQEKTTSLAAQKEIQVLCREKLAADGSPVEAKTYGDLGYRSYGTFGRYLSEFLILIAQSGGSVAYLVFIGQNLQSIFQTQSLAFTSYILLLVPIEIGLSWIGSLSALAPFSIFADICNILAMGIVVKEDIQQAIEGEFSFEQRTAFTSNLGGLPFAGGMAVFCFEGFGMTLALENSMQDRAKFPRLLAQTFGGITLVYMLFGFSGYMAYGDETRDIVTLNLPRNWSSLAVQVGLCLGLVFTFPIMVHPINEIVELELKRIKCFYRQNRDNNDSLTRLGKIGIYISRAVVVVVLAILASCVPAFGVFASFVGSTVCALISFVLPATFHLKLFGSSLHLWQKALDSIVLFCGLFFAVYGTYNTMVGV